MPRPTPRFAPFPPPSLHDATSTVLAMAIAVGAASTAWAQEPPTLPAINVTGNTVESSSEDTESYTTRDTSVGTKMPVSQKETPQSVSVMTRKRMDEQNLTTLDQVMGQATGVTTDLLGTAVIPTFYIRGYPVEYFEYDGVPIQTGGASWAMPDMIMFDRVEILRGAGGLFNGAGQPGGVINLVRKRPSLEPRLSGSLSAGSWDTYRGELDYSTPLNQNGSVRGRVAASYDNRHSYVDYANSRKRSIYGIIEANVTSDTAVSVGASYSKRDWLPAMMGVPRYRDGGDLGLSRSTFLSTPWTHWNFETTQVFADLTHQFNNDWKLKLSAVFDHETSDLKYAFVAGAVDRTTRMGPVLSGGANAYDNKQLGLDANLTGAFQAFGRRHEVVVGANWYDSKAESESGILPGFGGTPVDVFHFNPSSIPDPGDPIQTSNSRTNTRQYGIYGATRLKLAEPLTLLLGGRVSWWDSSTRNLMTGASASDYKQSAHFTPYAGIVYNLNPTWSVYTSYTDIFRVQSNFKDNNGNSLPPVKGANYEAGIKGSFDGGKLNTSFSIFRIRETNRAIQVSPVVVDNCCYATNGKVQSQGFEAEVSGELAPGWQAMAGYTFNTTKYLQDATNQGQSLRSFAPKHLLRLWTTYQLPGQLNAWTLGGGVDLQSGISSTGGSPSVKVSQGGYAVASAYLGYRIDKHWSVALNVNNLFDRTYYSRLGTGAFGPANFGNVYGEPRHVMLTLRAKL